ncbi:hypothetical protein DIPPA_05010 [Diplonema papillatum]|nr:hypothetical protein DIPPA_05010 [Diplonema papillatum]
MLQLADELTVSPTCDQRLQGRTLWALVNPESREAAARQLGCAKLARHGRRRLWETRSLARLAARLAPLPFGAGQRRQLRHSQHHQSPCDNLSSPRYST